MQKKTMNELSWIMIALGALLASFSVACILLPNAAIDYGTAGIAILISKMTGFNLSLTVLMVFLPFLIAGRFLLGRPFFLKALLGSAVYTIGLAIFEHVEIIIHTEHFIAVAFGGAILGLGLSLILKNGGCIDGSEILAQIIVSKISEKTGKDYSLTYLLIGFNVIVYLFAFILISPNAALMSLLVYIVATAIIDHFTDHFEAIKQVTIITKDPEQLILDINRRLHKTCTIINSEGAIAGENKTLICYISYFELQTMRDIISENKGSFSTVSTVDEILR